MVIRAYQFGYQDYDYTTKHNIKRKRMSTVSQKKISPVGMTFLNLLLIVE